MKKLIMLFSITLLIDSCIFPREVFHAYIPGGDAVGGLYFALFNNNTYQICGTGGLGEDCYTGDFILNNDTLTMIKLNKNIILKSNKFLISHYSTPNGRGDIGIVFQLNLKTNQSFGKNETYFVVTLDNLKNSH